MVILFRFEHGDLLIGWLLSFDAEIVHGAIKLFFRKILSFHTCVLFDLLYLALSHLSCTGPNGKYHCTPNDQSSAHPAVSP